MPDAVSPRRPYLVGNWKMHKTIAEARAYIDELVALLGASGDAVDVAVCPSYVALAAVVDAVRDTGVRVFAQNMHAAPEGAHTGEVSAPMLSEIAVDGVVLGHSERRRDDSETDRALGEKVPAALAAGLEPILCVGETEQERDAGETEQRLGHQVEEDLARVPDS